MEVPIWITYLGAFIGVIGAISAWMHDRNEDKKIKIELQGADEKDGAIYVEASDIAVQTVLRLIAPLNTRVKFLEDEVYKFKKLYEECLKAKKAPF